MKPILQPISRPWLIVAILAAFVALSIVLWNRDPSVAMENHFIENSQVTLLLLASIFHGWRWRHAADAVVRIYHLTLGLLCISLSVREVDIDRLGRTEIFEPLENAVRMVLVMAWLLLFFSLFRHRVALWSRKFDLALSPCSRISIIAIFGYGMSWPFDKLIFPFALPTQMLVEESLQVSATILFAAALWQAFQRQPDPPVGSRTV